MNEHLYYFILLFLYFLFFLDYCSSIPSHYHVLFLLWCHISIQINNMQQYANMLDWALANNPRSQSSFPVNYPLQNNSPQIK